MSARIVTRMVKRGLAGLALLCAIPLGLIAYQMWQDVSDTPSTQLDATQRSAQIVRGAYLAKAGDCMACHTQRGGQPYAGGRAMTTPYGQLFTPNLTPDAETGLGRWSATDFWRAMHLGKSKNGAFLYPAFPFPNYTKVTREDSDALYAYLQSLPPVKQANPSHTLGFPYNQRWLLGLWRTLYFAPQSYVPEAAQSAEWNRGAYLVQGLGHCSACHASQRAWGAAASSTDLAGGLIPVLNWYAPALTSGAEQLDNYSTAELQTLMRHGVSERRAVFGPMAEVVRQSLQHLTEADVTAMAVYLKSLPATATPRPSEALAVTEDSRRVLKLGAQLYEKHCQDCHQANGAGQAPAYPALAGHSAASHRNATNLVRMILNGGFPPSTAGNPRPYGMPPFGHSLSDAEIAALASYVQQQWGHPTALISAEEVGRARGSPLD